MILEEGKVFIRHFIKDGRNKTEVTFEREPILLQFAPYPEDTSKILRAYFKGSAPSWLWDFDGAYEVVQTLNEHGKGFAIVKRNKPFSDGIFVSPFLKGQLKELLENMGSDNEATRNKLEEKLFSDLQVVENNLRFYPEVFAELGIYYRTDESGKKTSAMYANPNFWAIVHDKDCATLEDWEFLVKQLTTVREYPLELEEIAETEIEAISIETTDVIDENEILEEVSEPSSVAEELEELEEVLEIVEVEEIVDELVELEEIDESTIEESSIIEETEVESITNDGVIEMPVLEVVQSTSKKEGVVAGQTLLF